MRISAERTKLSNREATGILGSVTSFDLDCSLGILLRAIAINHMETISINEIKKRSGIAKYRTSHPSDIKMLIRECEKPVCLIEIPDEFDATARAINEDNWNTFDDKPLFLNRYLSQFCKSKIFINKESQRVVALVDKHITHIWIQAFESMLWAILPWYYPMKDNETIAFFKKLSVGNKNVTEEEAITALVEYANAAAEKIDFRTLKLHQMLDDIADQVRQNQMKMFRSNVEDSMSSINDYSRRLGELYEALDAAQTALSALENSAPSTDNSMFKFFDGHKNLSLISVENCSLKYGVQDTLEFYDEDEAKKLFDNPDGWVARLYDATAINYFKELFVNKRGIIRVGASFRLRDMKLVVPLRGENYFDNTMPNPHVYYFACSGGNDLYYSKYAQSGEWDLAIEQSISATKNWSVGDSAVGKKMLEWITNNEIPFIYVTDGSPIERVSPDMQLVTYQKFKEIVNATKERGEKKEENDG